jgi:hypothetical protein
LKLQWKEGSFWAPGFIEKVIQESSQKRPAAEREGEDDNETMAEDEEIAALVIDNGSGMCKGEF